MCCLKLQNNFIKLCIPVGISIDILESYPIISYTFGISYHLYLLFKGWVSEENILIAAFALINPVKSDLIFTDVYCTSICTSIRLSSIFSFPTIYLYIPILGSLPLNLVRYGLSTVFIHTELIPTKLDI